MRRYLFDTGIAGDYINRRHGVFGRARQEVARGSSIGICTPVLGELYYGVEFSSSRDRNMQRLKTALPTWTVWPFNEAAAAVFGRICADLRRIGRGMQQIDIQVAAVALSLGNCTVVTTDADLTAISGLPVENWST